jgi:copper homeostasis protein
MPASPRITLEVCIESVADARAATAGGADRLELCAALDLDGLTPSLGLYQEVREATHLPIVVMIRPRPGDFGYSADELRVMLRDLDAFRPLRPDGFVFGALRADGQIDTATCNELRARAGGIPCIFHRAFDCADDPGAAVEQLAQAGFVRLLTSGRAPDALAGAAAVAETVRQAAGRIEVLPCGRVRASNAVELVRRTGCDQVHGSFAVVDDRQIRRTNRKEVAATRAALDRAREARGDPVS